MECAWDVGFCMKPHKTVGDSQRKVAHLLFTFLNHGGMDRACVLSCNHHQGLSLNIELTIFSVVWPWCFACAGSSSLHGWIHFTMNACAHAVG